MSEPLAAVVPVFFVILLGLMLKRGRVVAEAFWVPAERLTYYVTFPALLVANLARADMGAVAWGPLVVVAAGGVLLAAGGLLVLRPWLDRRFGLTDASFTSLFQGTIRPNTYIGLAVASALYGGPGITLTAICIAAVVPLVNVLAVSCLVRFGANQGGGVRGIARGIATNPLILACLGGLLLNVSGLGAPGVAGDFLDILGRAALPIGLLAVGAGLAPLALREMGPPLALATAIKLLILPLVVGLGGLALGLEATSLAVAVLYAGLPCSASSYVLARQMGGDAPLMASIITAQTLVAAVTIPWVGLLVMP